MITCALKEDTSVIDEIKSYKCDVTLSVEPLNGKKITLAVTCRDDEKSYREWRDVKSLPIGYDGYMEFEFVRGSGKGPAIQMSLVNWDVQVGDHRVHTESLKGNPQALSLFSLNDTDLMLERMGPERYWMVIGGFTLHVDALGQGQTVELKRKKFR